MHRDTKSVPDHVRHITPDYSEGQRRGLLATVQMGTDEVALGHVVVIPDGFRGIRDARCSAEPIGVDSLDRVYQPATFGQRSETEVVEVSLVAYIKVDVAIGQQLGRQSLPACQMLLPMTVRQSLCWYRQACQL